MPSESKRGEVRETRKMTLFFSWAQLILKLTFYGSLLWVLQKLHDPTFSSDTSYLWYFLQMMCFLWCITYSTNWPSNLLVSSELCWGLFMLLSSITGNNLKRNYANVSPMCCQEIRPTFSNSWSMCATHILWPPRYLILIEQWRSLCSTDKLC